MNEYNINESRINQEEEDENITLKSVPGAFQFLNQALDQPFDDLPQWLWANGNSQDHSDKETKAIMLMRSILTDYYTNCLLLTTEGPVDEEGFFVKSIIPIFKCYSATYGTLYFEWSSIETILMNLLKVLEGQFQMTADELFSSHPRKIS
jgi:hypothetical protein